MREPENRTERRTVQALADEMRRELVEGILPFWAERMPDATLGGFYGCISGAGRVERNAVKGAVLNARMLWTFSEAAAQVDEDRYRPLADRAYEYLTGPLWDATHGGLFWSVTAGGWPCDPRKHVYAQAFGIYGFAAYHRATGRADALDCAVRLYRLIEQHAAGNEPGDYIEALSRDWRPIDDVRLSEKDLDAPRSMNTHLHLLEAYAALLRVWPDEALRARLAALVRRFFDSILDEARTTARTFFDEAWRPVSDERSFGHDIEAAWLLLDAAEAVGDPHLIEQARKAVCTLADAVRRDGQDADGGLFNALHGDRLDTDKHWWPQAEAVVGFIAAYETCGDAVFLDAAWEAWHFIENRLVDRDGGEWYGRVSRAGEPYAEDDKAGLWKCPYHNGRACLEIIARSQKIPEVRT